MRSLIRNIPGAVLVFGLLCGFAFIGVYGLPLERESGDYLSLGLLLAALFGAQLALDLRQVKEKYLHLFLVSFLTYCLTLMVFAAYLYLQARFPHVRWPALFGVGAAGSAVLALLSLLIRQYTDRKQKNAGSPQS